MLPIGRRAVGIVCETISNSQEDPPQPKGGRKVRPAGDLRERCGRPAIDPRKTREKEGAFCGFIGAQKEFPWLGLLRCTANGDTLVAAWDVLLRRMWRMKP